MKKYILLIFILSLITTFCYAQQQNMRQRRANPRINRNQTVFGISQKDYESLNLTEEQKKKAEEIQKNYMKAMMPLQPQKPKQNTGSSVKKEQPKMPSQEELKKQAEERKKAQEEMLKQFTDILTEEQKALYSKALQNVIEEQKNVFRKQFEEMDKTLKFTPEQKSELEKLLTDYKGDQTDFNTKFYKLFTPEQITAFQEYQKAQMQKMNEERQKRAEEMKQRNPGERGQGRQRGQGRRNRENRNYENRIPAETEE